MKPVIFISLLCAGLWGHARSIYPTRIADSSAVYFEPGAFPVQGDGIQDDSEALQQAIDQVFEQGGFGLVFIPDGRYRLNKTVYVWKGIRLIGYGKERPVFIRDGRDPAYQVEDHRYMLYFASGRRRNGSVVDANAGTFYSAVSNINFEIRNGNAKMVGIRSNFAQHCFISHCDFHTGDALASVERVGNEISNCRFYGGQYGLLAYRTAPGWPFMLMDSYFEGQQIAAIETEDCGLTIIRTRFRDVPSAILTREGKSERLYLEGSRFENISGPAVVIDDEANACSQYNMRELTCIDVPVLAKLRKSGREIGAGGRIYEVAEFSHGLQIRDLGQEARMETVFSLTELAEIPPLPQSDVPVLPPPDQWVNMAELGTLGDAAFDNTEIIREAIARHRVLYFPTGRYRISETLRLRPGTMLIGLNPITTQILITDRSPAFSGIGSPKALIESSRGGHHIISGIGIDAGGINPRAAGIKWMAGEHSLLNDVKFLGGHGTFDTEGKYLDIYNNNRTADSDIDRKWDSQYWSLWVTEGGGGTLKNIWTASPFAQAGLCVSNTSTPGRVYGMSLEHHVRYEAQFRNVSNWGMYAFQLEEEPGEGWNVLPVEIEACTNLRFANLYFYRTSRTRSAYPHALQVKHSRELEFCNVHSYSSTRYVFDQTLYDAGHDRGIRALEIARVRLSGRSPDQDMERATPGLRKVAGGFEFIDGLCADAAGNVYFQNSRWHEIYAFAPSSGKLVLLCDLPLSPAGLAVEKTGRLLVKSLTGAVASLDPGQWPVEAFQVLPEDTLPGKKDLWVAYPAYLHSPVSGFQEKLRSGRVRHHPSQDRSTVLVNTGETREPFNLNMARPGETFYLVQDEIHKTYCFEVGPGGQLGEAELFAEQGDYQAIADTSGRVYIVADQVYVYDPDGKLLDTIYVPERPSSIALGGASGQTLFITARTSLYAMDIRELPVR